MDVQPEQTDNRSQMNFQNVEKLKEKAVIYEFLLSLTLERGVITPVWQDARLDFLIKTFLHGVHILKLVCMNALVLTLFSPLTGLFQG